VSSLIDVDLSLNFYNALNVVLQKFSRSGFIRYFALLLPLSPFKGIIYHLLDKNSKIVLDVGCGRGSIARLLRHRGFKARLIGFDLYLPYLKHCKDEKLYSDLVLGDMRYLPFRNGLIDEVLALEVIEHLSKSEGRLFLKCISQIAKRQIIITTPVGFMQMYHEKLSLTPLTHSEAELLVHKSGWVPLEFRAHNFEVYGQIGPRVLPRDIAYGLSYILPLNFFLPNTSWSMVCVKRIS